MIPHGSSVDGDRAQGECSRKAGSGMPRRVFACSNVTIDYFTFLVTCLEGVSRNLTAVTAVDEATYRTASRGSALARTWLRLMMYVAYPIRLAWAAASARRGDMFVVTSNTFFAPALVSVLARWRGIRVVHLLYDLYPDAIEVAGRIKTGGFLALILGRVARANLRWPDGTVFLGTFLGDFAERRWGATRIRGVIAIATDLRLYSSEPPQGGVEGPLRLHYGGQLGLMHDAESLVAGLHRVAQANLLGKSVEFNGLVSGSRSRFFKDALREVAGVTVGGTLSSAEWRRHAERFHVGVVTLSPGGATVCLPSKTYAMMAAGLAIVAICPGWSDLARLIEETRAGWVIDNAGLGDPLASGDFLNACRQSRPITEVAADFESVVLHLLQNRDDVARRRQNAWAAMRARFSPAQIKDEWFSYLSRVSSECC